MSQLDLAAALGVSQPYISQIEAGDRNLQDSQFRNLPAGIREPATAAAMEELAERAKVIMGEAC